jgi:dihydrofolate synthase / folylpolyglutamate synthase
MAASPLAPPESPFPELTYEAAVEYLFGRINYERVPTSKYSTDDFQLPRMSTLLERLGNPQLTIPAVHITGTKGKGSTAVMTAGMLQAAGHTVGLFTSPHLVRFEERMTVNGRLPAPEKIVSLVQKLKEVAADLEQSDETRPTFFELSTALAWMVFQDAGCDLVVLEVGLGGRLDTTTLCTPLVTVITSVSRDHMKLLGDTLELIAREKAGIVKPGVPCLIGVDQPSVVEVIAEVCRERGAELLQLGHEIRIEHRHPTPGRVGPAKWTIDVRTPASLYRGMHVPLAGEFQTRNAALAIAAVEVVSQRLGGITEEQMRAGLAQVSWPLRLEVAQQSPLILLDAAHNDASMRELCRAALSIPAGTRTLIFGTSRDKEAAVMLGIAGAAFDQLILTKYSTNPRAWPVEELVEIAKSATRTPIQSRDTVAEALHLADQTSQPGDLICVAGSFFLAAEARETLRGSE